MAELPPPAVAADLYDEAYYRHTCAGAEVWDGSDGARIHPMYLGVLLKAGLQRGERLLDVGCGRGELLAAAAQAGAAEATGVEYSAAACRLAAQTIAAHDEQATCRVVEADARGLPLPDAAFDLVTLIDVVEHLTPAELGAALAEAHRVLAPGGRILVHTMPNRWALTVGYPILRALALWRWPANPRTPEERTMHVNELTRRDLAAALRTAGFEQVDVRYGRWVREDVAPSRAGRAILRALARFPLTKPIGAADLWGYARCAVSL